MAALGFLDRGDTQQTMTADRRYAILGTFAQAFQLSTHVLLGDPDQLAGQLTGRLGDMDDAAITALVQGGAQKKKTPWLRPLVSSLAPPGGPLLRTLTGHSDQVYAAAIDRSGRLATSISRDKTLRIWDLESGEVQTVLRTDGEAWNAVALSPDGSRVVCQSGSILGTTLEVWDLRQEKAAGTLAKEDNGDELLGGVARISYLPDSRHLVASSHRSVNLWDIDRGACVGTLGTHEQAIHALAVADNGRLVATGAENEIKIWELGHIPFQDGKPGTLKHTLASKAGIKTGFWSTDATPSAITFFQDDRLILVAFSNNILEIWDAETGRLEASWQGPGDEFLAAEDEIKTIAVSGDDTLAILGIRDGRILVQELSSGATRHTIEAHDKAVIALSTFPLGAGFLSASWDGTLKCWDLARLETRRGAQAQLAGQVQALAVSMDGHYTLSTGKDRLLRIWDSQEARLEHTLPVHTGGLYAVIGPKKTPQIVGGHASPGLSLTAAADPTPETGAQLNPAARIQVLEIDSQKVVCTLDNPAGWVKSMAFSTDAHSLLCLSQDHHLVLWDLERGEIIAGHAIEAVEATAMCCLAYSHRALLAAPDGGLKIIDLDSGDIENVGDGGQGALHAVLVYQQDQRAITAPRAALSDDFALQVWDLVQGKPLARLVGHSDEVESLAVTPDERWAASGSVDDTIILWDLTTFRRVHTLRGHTDRVRALCFLPEGRLASGSLDHTLRIWDITTGQALRTLRAHRDWVESLAIAPDSGALFSGSGDSTIRVWDTRDYTCRAILECAPYGRIAAMLCHPDGDRLVIADGDPVLKSWQLPDGNGISVLRTEWPELPPVLAAARHLAVFVHAQPVLRVLDMRTGIVVHTLSGHVHRVSAAAITSDGSFAVSGSEKGEVIVWNLEQGRPIHRLKHHADRINQVILARDDATCLTRSRKSLAAWDIATGRLLRSFPTDGNALSSLALSPSGYRCALGMDVATKSQLLIWDLRSGVQTPLEPLLRGRIFKLLWLSENRILILTGGSDFRIFNLSTGELERQWRAGDFEPVGVMRITGSPWVVSRGWYPTVQVWDVLKQECLCVFTADSDLTACTLTPDGKTLVAGDKTGQVHFFRLENFPEMGGQ